MILKTWSDSMLAAELEKHNAVIANAQAKIKFLQAEIAKRKPAAKAAPAPAPAKAPAAK